jgi:RNA polymerase sigma-70 factor (ECF subfamily)
MATTSALRTRPRPARLPQARQERLDDVALMTAVAREDTVALGALYDRFGGVAYGLALRVARDPGLAEEAVQDAFLSVWRSARSFDGDRGSPRNWLLTLVYRRAVDLVDRASRRRELPTETLPEDESVSAADTVTLREERRRVHSALALLPLKQRESLELAYFGGYTQSEIALHLGLPLGTIKSRMFKGLSRLSELLGDDGQLLTPPPA